MQGVEILTSAQVATEFTFNLTAFWIAFVVICGIGLMVAVKVSIYEDDWRCMIPFGGMFICFGLLMGMIVGVSSQYPVNYETQYKVTISEEVSMAEFYEHYEVIDQDGKIFTVREKINESN